MGSDQRVYLPPEWNNEERIRVLMGPMPSAQDEVARTARLTFWVAAIHQWCRTTNKLTFTLQESLSAFRRGTQHPLCLSEALLHMNSLNEAVPLNELPLGERVEESWVGWGRRVFVAGPTRFAWNKVKQVIGADNIQGKVFVNTKLLQEMCDNVLKMYWESISNEHHSLKKPLTLASLYQRVCDSVGSPDNLHLVVETLAYTGRASTAIHNDTTYVKFVMPGDTQKPVITQVEIAENELQCAQIQVEANITGLNTEISSLQQDVMSALKEKSKTKALSLLRRKKRVEKSLATQMGALENVTTCLLQLQETQINKQVLGAFRVGVEAIRSVVAGGHSADNAATTMDDLQELLEECQDISSALATGVGPRASDIDDDALAEELENLVSEDQDMKQVDDNLANRMRNMELPEVPRNNPVSSLQDLQNPFNVSACRMHVQDS